MGEM